jgi:hypothetical protein
MRRLQGPRRGSSRGRSSPAPGRWSWSARAPCARRPALRGGAAGGARASPAGGRDRGVALAPRLFAERFLEDETAGYFDAYDFHTYEPLERYVRPVEAHGRCGGASGSRRSLSGSPRRAFPLRDGVAFQARLQPLTPATTHGSHGPRIRG